MDIGYWITTAIAGYAAALSTYNALAKRRSDKRSAKVTIREGLPSPGFGPDICFVVNVCNTGKRPIIIEHAQLSWSDNFKDFSFSALACGTVPCELSDGQSCKFQFPFDAYRQAVKERGLATPIRVRAYVYDVAGDVYTTEW